MLGKSYKDNLRFIARMTAFGVFVFMLIRFIWSVLSTYL
jgi:F0F1-type ATP synthase membrane subunit b/b'